MQHEHLEVLLEKFNAGTISDEEMLELDNWYLSLEAGIEELFDSRQPETSRLTHRRLQELKMRLGQESTPLLPAKRITMLNWLARIAVIVAGVALTTGLYFAWNKKQPTQPVVRLQKTQTPAHDVAPGSSTPVLTLADGSRISLDSLASLSTFQNANNLLQAANGELHYSAQSAATGALEFNTLSVPRGSKTVHVTLSDGTQVWLNAFSSLRYPVLFTGNERRVEITGEAYFEVAKNASKPFIVEKDQMKVRVLGTHFNVNGYVDEQDLKVTLLEGSVKVDNAVSSKLLSPGEQAALQSSGNISINNTVDLEEVLAWKDGRFEFNGQTIRQIMKQVERWYDVQVVYKGNIPDDHFVGDISRMENVSEVLKMLAHTDLVSFSIENKTITVSGK